MSTKKRTMKKRRTRRGATKRSASAKKSRPAVAPTERNQRSRRSGFVPAGAGIEVTPGEMLRAIRELQELTQSELARKSGISQSNISALETGARDLGRDRALVLARVLKVHPAVLLFPDFDISEVA